MVLAHPAFTPAQERGGWRQLGGRPRRQLLLPCNHAGRLGACLRHALQRHLPYWLHLGYCEPLLIRRTFICHSRAAQHLGRPHLHRHQTVTTDRLPSSDTPLGAVTRICTTKLWMGSSRDTAMCVALAAWDDVSRLQQMSDAVCLPQWVSAAMNTGTGGSAREASR